MFDRLQTMVQHLAGLLPFQEEASGGRVARDDPRVAVAALFFHVVSVDGVISEEERLKVREMLSEGYGVSGDELESLVKAGRKADDAAVDLYAFTRVIKQALEPEECRDLVGLLWDLVYTDGERHELEDHTVFRISELLGVDSRERVLERRRAAGRIGTTDLTGPGDA